MHKFCDLIQLSTAYNIKTLESEEKNIIDEMQTSASTPLVKSIQLVQLQKIVISVGMFSMLDAILQEELNCKNGFRAAEEILEDKNLLELKEKFCDLELAINVLKHGKGRSYNTLVQKAKSLPFRVKLPGESFFFEGDVSEVSTLIYVDDAFVTLCAAVIHEVSNAIVSQPS